MLAHRLTKARERTLRLVEFDDAELHRQYDPLMSPLLWDLAHIGWQEELWLLRGNDPHRPGMLAPDVERLYDAFENSRASRVDLPLLPPSDARAFCATVRNKALDTLDGLTDDDVDADFNFGLVISHENQHDETMLQALNLRTGPALLDHGAALPAGRPGVAGTSVLVPGGPFVLGVDAVTEPHSLDNERPSHVVDVPAFRIGRVPVTNGEWQQFVDDGGYRQPQWWSQRGWSHCEQSGLTAPQFWNADGTRTRFGHVEDIPADEPVQHITYFEAEAFAAWAVRGCPPRSSGRRRARGIRTPARDADSLGAHPNPPVRSPTWAATRCAPLRSVRIRQAHRHTAPSRCSVMCGSGRHLHCGRGLGSHPCSTSCTASRSSTATTRCCAAVRGRSRATSCGQASETGTTRSAGRSSAVCDWLGTSDVSPPGLAG